MKDSVGTPKPFDSVAVLGGGAWGTALAQVAASAGRKTTIWARETEVVEAINAQHLNPLFLPGAPLNPAVTATADLASAAGAHVILAVPPAQHMRSVLRALRPSLRTGSPVVLCAKGVERSTLALMAEVGAAELPQTALAVLSGPGFAKDVAAGLPTAITLACQDPSLAARITATIGLPTFRPYTTDDLVGAEIAGSVKNVIAIACGMAEGRKLGDGARAALITRGFAEMTRLGLKLGAKAETLSGLCGLGDLVLTCTSMNSRNMSLGAALGQGRALKDVLAERRSVAEGMESAPAIVALAARHGIEMPICEAVHAVLEQRTSIDDAIRALLSRPVRSEGV